MSPELRELAANRHVDLAALLERAVTEAKGVFGGDRATLWLVDKARRQLVSRVGELAEEMTLGIDEGVAGWVARHGEVVSIPRSESDPRFERRFDEQTGYTTRSMLAGPVRNVEGRVIAVLQLLNHPRGYFHDADERKLATTLDDIAAILDASSLGSQLGSSRRLAFRFNHVVGTSPKMEEAFERAERAAKSVATVMLRGESGTGKGLVARAIHENSTRADGPLVVVDCSTLPPELVENELFGHVRGAYTGADRDAPGLVAAAEGGTLFLDEVGELAPHTQGRLLRLLQDRTYTRVGDARERRADVRFVSATNRPLEDMVRAGTFREDLYYRLRVVEIRLPPLRERGAEDLDRLTDHFLHVCARRHGRPPIGVTAQARAKLHGHPWLGNVRELEHCLEAAVVLAQSDAIDADLIEPATLTAARDPRAFSTDAVTLAEVERAYILHVLELCEGNKSHAARVLGIGRNTLLRKIKD